jgi:2-polyprenyl-6-methoxyphenol hydroxylase-like FAD-dependent oxidoreductase
MREIGGHAVVLGAGMAGLLTAAVLVPAYERVTVVERDPVPEPGHGRRGVPQGRHTHAMLPRGAQVLDELLPGLTGQLVAAGAVLADPLADFRMTIGGHPLRQAPVGAPVVQASRPFLEGHVRDRVLAEGVELVTGRDVVGLLADAGGTRVTGVRIIGRAVGSAEELLAADLVVDATGRAGRTPAWLEALGHPGPPKEEFPVDVAYASRFLRLPAGADVAKGVGTAPVPGHPRGMMLLAVEGGRRLLTLAGITPAHRPPVNPDGFLAFAGSVAPPDVFAAIRDAEPLGHISGYRYPSYLRRRYTRLRRFPAGLLVVGDALCSFSPVYAQGMSVAALQALALRRCLERGPDGLARRFFRAAERIVAGAWHTGVSADLALPEVPGRRPQATRLVNAYIGRVLAAAEDDADVARRFMRVTGMLDSPVALLHPAVLRPALLARPRRPGSRAGRPVPSGSAPT